MSAYRVLCGCLLVISASALIPINHNPASTSHNIEAHHSLSPPMDKSQVYWNFGGSTVLTRNFIRLTPSTQDRRGWLWNEYPVESANWEVEFKLEVFSKPHFGGDGFAFWVLGADSDPSKSKEPDFLNGPVFGLKNSFQGFGVVFDVYDNDNRRNNPSIFVLDNPTLKPTPYNHDNDYEDNMVTQTPDKVPGHPENDAAGTQHKAYKCVADFRNIGRTSKILIKYLHGILHVYVDTQDGAGYKFCLAVELKRSFVEYHFAFTAATGQVADNHDIYEISTKYLADSDKEFDDTLLQRLGTSTPPQSGFESIVSALLLLFSAILTAFMGMQMQTYKTMIKDKIDEVQVAHKLNEHMMEHWAAHGALTLILFFFGSWLIFLANLAIVAKRGYLYSRRMHQVTPHQITGRSLKDHNASRFAALFQPSNRILVSLIVYTITLVAAFIWLF